LLQDLDAIAAQLNELGADERLATTVIQEEENSEEEEEEVDQVNRDGTLLASEPTRSLYV